MPKKKKKKSPSSQKVFPPKPHKKDWTIYYYKQIFQKIRNENTLVLNWSAFFCGPLWFFHRKLYLPCCLSLIFFSYVLCDRDFTWIIHGISKTLGISKSVNIYFFSNNFWLFYFLYSVLCGIFGNNLFYKTAQRRIKKGYHLIPDSTIKTIVKQKSFKIAHNLLSSIPCFILAICLIIAHISPTLGHSIEHFMFFYPLLLFYTPFLVRDYLIVKFYKQQPKTNCSFNYEVNDSTLESYLSTNLWHSDILDFFNEKGRFKRPRNTRSSAQGPFLPSGTLKSYFFWYFIFAVVTFGFTTERAITKSYSPELFNYEFSNLPTDQKIQKASDFLLIINALNIINKQIDDENIFAIREATEIKNIYSSFRENLDQEIHFLDKNSDTKRKDKQKAQQLQRGLKQSLAHFKKILASHSKEIQENLESLGYNINIDQLKKQALEINDKEWIFVNILKTVYKSLLLDTKNQFFSKNKIRSQYIMGYAFLRLAKIAPNKEDYAYTGINLLKKLSSQNVWKYSRLASSAISNFYLHGIENIPSQKEQAHKWANIAFQQGYYPILTRIALNYRNGVGTKKDINKYLDLIEEAAYGYNIASAQYYLAKDYLEGTICKNNIKKARSLINLAIKNGEYRALKLIKSYQKD